MLAWFYFLAKDAASLEQMQRLAVRVTEVQSGKSNDQSLCVLDTSLDERGHCGDLMETFKTTYCLPGLISDGFYQE